YNANRQLTHVDLGQPSGDDFDHNELKDFEYDSQGHIIAATHDDGHKNHSGVTTSYLYANDYASGEYTAQNSPTMDTGNYSVIQTVAGTYDDSAPDFPQTGMADHIVIAGETLQSIAGAIYGHPELWFVIADANGLNGSEQLQAGMRLIIPNSV